MPKRGMELVWTDVQAIWLDTYPELAQRGMYCDWQLLLVTSLRKPENAHDIALELCVRRRNNSTIVWRGSESFRVPGRMKLRPVGNVVVSLLQRAIHDVMDSYPLPGPEQ